MMNFAAKLSVKLAVVLVALLLASSAGAAARQQKSVRTGESWVVEMQGNPSTGYKWRLDAAASADPSIVKVEDLDLARPNRQARS